MPKAVREHGLTHLGKVSVVCEIEVPINDLAVDGIAANLHGDNKKTTKFKQHTTQIAMRDR